MSKPIGAITRGTTAPNRLRRVDRWIAWRCAAVLRHADDPLVVDLGFGASPITTLELHDRLRQVRADVRVVGVEIDPARVAAASAYSRPGVGFMRGGFELPVDGRPVVVRALNVLRQYAEAEVSPAWSTMRARLGAGGLVIDGTCDEIGRRASWVAVNASGPVSLTLSTHLGSLQRPNELAERLPKALIHRNVAGERIHALLVALDREWDRAAPQATFGAVQRWLAAIGALSTQWQLLDGPGRWRLGEVTVPWSTVCSDG